MKLKTRLVFACAAGITAVSASAASADPPDQTPTPQHPTDVPTPPNPSNPSDPANPQIPPPTDPMPTTPAPPTVPTPTTPAPTTYPTDTTAPAPATPGTTTTTTVVTPAPDPTATGVYATTTPRTVTVIEPDPYGYAWVEPRLASQFGVGMMIGGGVAGFTDRTLRDSTSNVGGLWDAHLTLGTHVPLGIEMSYTGTAANLHTLAGVDNGQLIGTTVEGALRFNILPHMMLDPYVFAGVGYQRYDVRNVRLAQSDTGFKSSDAFAEFPMGAGLSWRDWSGLTIDLRGTYRRAADSSLVLDPASGNYASLHTWEASGGIGYEF